MPRKYKKKRSKKPKRAWYERKYTAMEIAGKALVMAKYVKSLVNVEKKYFDTSESTAVSTTATLTHLTAVAQGDGATSRDGNTFRCKSLQMRDVFSINGAATVSNIRYIVFIWKDDTAPTVADILDDSDYTSLLNIETSSKYRILRDYSYSIDQSGDKGSIMRNGYIPLNLVVKFDNTTGADYMNNSIWALAVSSEATNTVARSSKYRIRFVDN